MTSSVQQVYPTCFDQNITNIFSGVNAFHYNSNYPQLLRATDTKMGLSRSGILGTCMNFAPRSELERRDRVVSSKYEKGTLLSPDGELFHLEPIKYYARSAAGHTQKAEDILSAQTLHRCIEYICKVLLLIPERLGEEDSEERSDFFTFIDNRLRSIGKDYESQSIAGHIHMHDMGTLFRIYIIRMLECTKTVVDCEKFSAFKKLNNERMDAIQGNLLKYIHDQRYAVFFNEIFPLFLLRSIGHDAELDSRHWWSEMPISRRQMLSKMSSSPLTQVIDSLSIFRAIQPLHCIETGQWFAFCRHIRSELFRKLHVTLISGALSYVRVRALMEIHSGRPTGAQKIRYTGNVSLKILATNLLFRDVDELNTFASYLNINHDNIHSGELICGKPVNPEFAFIKNGKQRLLLPLCTLPYVNPRNLIFNSAVKSVVHVPERDKKIKHILEGIITKFSGKSLPSTTESSSFSMHLDTSLDTACTNSLGCNNLPCKEGEKMLTNHYSEDKTSFGLDTQEEKSNLRDNQFKQEFPEIQRSHEVLFMKESVIRMCGDQSTSNNKEIRFASRTIEKSPPNLPDQHVVCRWLRQNTCTPQWFSRASKHLFSVLDDPYCSSKLHLQLYWLPFYNAKLREQEFTRLFNYKDHLIGTDSGHVVEAIKHCEWNLNTIFAQRGNCIKVALFILFFTCATELEQVYRIAREISIGKQFQSFRFAILVADNKEMPLVYQCISEMQNEFIIDVIAHTSVENVFDNSDTLEHTFENLCISSMQQVM